MQSPRQIARRPLSPRRLTSAASAGNMRRMPWIASWRRAPAMLRPLLLLLLLLPLCLPPVLLLLGALHPPGRVPVPGDLWPDTPSLASLLALFTDVPMARALVNSLLLVLLYVPLAVLLAAAAGFGLRFLAPGWKLAAYGLWIVAASIPATATWLPRFLASASTTTPNFSSAAIMGSWSDTA